MKEISGNADYIISLTIFLTQICDMPLLTNWMLWILNLSTRKQTTLPKFLSVKLQWATSLSFSMSLLSPGPLRPFTYPVSRTGLLLLRITSPRLLLSLPQNPLIIVIFYTKWTLSGWWKRSEIKSSTTTSKKKKTKQNNSSLLLVIRQSWKMGGRRILGKLGEWVRVEMIKKM